MLAQAEFLPVKFRRNGKKLLCEAQNRILVRVHAFVADKHHLDAGEYEKCAEQVKCPRELLDDGRTRCDQSSAHHKRAEDAPEQHAVLELHRHPEIGEDECDDEDVVHRERQLDDVASDELNRVLLLPTVDERGSDEQSKHK